MFNRSLNKFILGWVIFLAQIVGQVAPVSAQVLKNTDDGKSDSFYKSDFWFRDANGFLSADSMYTTADTLPYSTVAGIYISNVVMNISNGRLLEEEKNWSQITKAEPYRKNSIMMAGAERIADRHAALIRTSFAGKPNLLDAGEAKKFSALYKDGDFKTFIAEGRKLLLRYPRNSDIRNNVGLALMHTNQDFAALLELETIRRLDSMHVPALINLVALYERLGKHREAREISRKLLNIQNAGEIKFPQVTYNAAWLSYMDADYSRTDSLLKSIGVSDFRESGNYKKLLRILRTTYKEKPTYQVGIMGKMGYTLADDFFSWISIIVTVVILIIAYFLTSSKSKKLFIQLLLISLILAFAYILEWGIPTAETWYYFVGYSLLPFLIMVALVILAILFSS